MLSEWLPEVLFSFYRKHILMLDFARISSVHLHIVHIQHTSESSTSSGEINILRVARVCQRYICELAEANSCSFPDAGGGSVQLLVPCQTGNVFHRSFCSWDEEWKRESALGQQARCEFLLCFLLCFSCWTNNFNWATSDDRKSTHQERDSNCFLGFLLCLSVIIGCGPLQPEGFLGCSTWVKFDSKSGSNSANQARLTGIDYTVQSVQENVRTGDDRFWDSGHICN